MSINVLLTLIVYVIILKIFDIFDFMKINIEHFDLSDCPKQHPLYCGNNKNVLVNLKMKHQKFKLLNL